MNNNYIALNDNRKLGYEDYGDKSDSAIIMFHGTPGSRIAGLEDSPLPDAPHPDRATFYHIQDGRAQQWREIDLSIKLAGGGFMATPSDLAKLGVAWLDDAFISPETRQQFWTPQKLADGSDNEQNYALNWRVSEATEGVPFTYMHHGGVSKGSMAWLAVIPEERMAVAFAINTRVWPFSRWYGVFSDLLQTFANSTSVGFQSR